jgi:hypothetical protein
MMAREAMGRLTQRLLAPRQEEIADLSTEG